MGVRIILGILIGLASLVLIWFAANRLLDEKLDPLLQAFIHSPSDRIEDKDNIAVGLLGLNAPQGADFLKYGAEIKALYDRGASSNQIQSKLHAPNGLRLSVTSDQISCWIDPVGYPVRKECLPFEEVAVVLERNRELLDRYKALYQLPHEVNVGYNGLTFLDISKLAIAEMRYEIGRKNYETAYIKWRDQFQFLRTYLRGQDTWRGKAVGLVVLGMNIPVIEGILLTNPDIGKTYFNELVKLLRPGGIEWFNPNGLMRAEYLIVDNLLEQRPPLANQNLKDLDWLASKLGQRNRIRNLYVRYAQEYSAALRLPWRYVPDELKRVGERYGYVFDWSHIIDPVGSSFLLEHIQWQLENPEIFREVHVLDGKLRLATLLVRVINEGIQDVQMSKFLESVGPQFGEPFSAGPMKWNPDKRQIYFPDSNNKCGNSSIQIPEIDTRGRRVPWKSSLGANC